VTANGARLLYAGLNLLDRQLVDRNQRLCGKVDDLELEEDAASGSLYVATIRTGPGALLQRLGRRRLGRWLERQVPRLFASDLDDPGRIPFGRVSEVGNHVTLAVDSEEVATFACERWVRDHLIGHIPGSGHHADE
jgi:hypothetical protein